MATDEYKRIARWYDPMLAPLLRSARERIVALLVQRKVSAVLDICCGTARLGEFARAAGMQYAGIDLSPAMLRTGQRHGPKNMIVLGDGRALPFVRDFFDVAVISLALHETGTERAEQILEEAFSVAPHVIVLDYMLAERNIDVPAQLLMQIPERIAGGQHWQNYRRFMRKGALQGLIQRMKLTQVTQKQIWLGAAAIVELKK